MHPKAVQWVFNDKGGAMETTVVLESRGICGQCKRPVISNQESAQLDGKLIHKACTPRQAPQKRSTLLSRVKR